MAINIIDELTKKLEEGKQKEMGLSDRLNYLDNYNIDVAVPQISSEGPKGYNPMNSLNALFQLISNRKAVSQDVSNQSAMNLDLLKEISTEQDKSKVDPYDTILKGLKLKQAEADLEKTNKDLGRTYNPETGTYEAPKVSQEKQDTIALVDELLGRDTGAVTGVPNVLKYLTGENQYTKNLIDQLVKKLSVDARQKLKGSGQISDYEAKMLEKSVSALRTNLSNKDFVTELMKIRSALAGETSQSNLTQDDEALINKYKNAGK